MPEHFLVDNHWIDRNLTDVGIPMAETDEVRKATLQRGKYLLKPDRVLLQMALRGDMSRRQIAHMLEVPAGTVSRRLHRIGRRLHHPLVIAVLEEDCPLAPDHRQLAVEHFVQGLSVRQLADLHRISRAQAQSILGFVKGWFKGRIESSRDRS